MGKFFLWAGVCFLSALGCEYRLDTEREVVERGTLGQEVFRILKKDLDRLEVPKGEAFAREQQTFVAALDTLLPEEMLDDLQQFLLAILPLYDLGVLPAVSQPIACVLADLSQDDELLQALWYSAHPQGYGWQDDWPIIRKALAHEGLAELVAQIGSLWLAHDGLGDDWQLDAEQDDVFAFLLSELARTLTEVEAPQLDLESDLQVLVDFLLSSDSRLADGSGSANWVLRTGPRGRALPAVDSLSGLLVSPFVDTDGDGWADLDLLTGDFVDAAGLKLDIPPPFDADGNPAPALYRYRDLQQSQLGAVLDQAAPLVSDGFAWELPDALPPLLGPSVSRQDEHGAFSGYDPAQAPLMALAHALRVLLDYDRLPQLLEVIWTLADEQEPQLARLLHEWDLAQEIVDQYPQATLADANRLIDDLLPLVQELVQRGFLPPLLRSLSDPRLDNLSSGLAAMVRYRDHLDDEVAGGMLFNLPTDFDLSDSVYANRSNLQRMFHLTRDTNGIDYTATVDLFNWFTIYDMLVFWLDSATDTDYPDEGLAEIDSLILPLIDEFDSTHPPVEDVNRFMNHSHSFLGHPVGHEGENLYQYNAESLLALEVSGLLDAFKPVVTVFTTRDRAETRSGGKLLADLLASVHPHYSPNLPGAAEACAHLRLCEPMWLEVLDETQLVGQAIVLINSLAAMSTSSGLDVLAELEYFADHLLAPNESLRTLNGDNWVLAGDRLSQISPISPLYLLLDASRQLDDAVAENPAADAAVDRAFEVLTDRFLTVSPLVDSWQFQNRRAWFLALNGLDFLQTRLTLHTEQGTLSARLAEFEQDLSDLIADRVLPRLVEILQLLAAEPGLPARLDALLLDILDDADASWTGRLRKSIARLIQDLLADNTALAHALARHIDPGAKNPRFVLGQGCVETAAPNDLISRVLYLTVRLLASQLPERQVAAELIRNAGKQASLPDGFVLGDFGQVIAAIHRADSGQLTEKSTTDLAHIFGEVSEYLLDQERGLEKLYLHVQRRRGL